MLRIGCIGCGNWGKILLKVWNETPGAEVAGLARKNPDRLDEFDAQYPHAQRYATAEDLIADDEIDAVSIATPPPAHFELARAALTAGRHVFVEKPMCLKVSNAEKLISLVEETNRILMVGHLMEHHGPVKTLRDLIETGTLGHLHHLQFQRLKLGRVRSQENVLYSFAPHDISVAGYLLDAAPATINATGHACLQPNIEDIAFVNMMYDNELSAHIHVSWLHPETVRRAVVVGTDAMAVWDDMADTDKVILTESTIDDNLEAVERDWTALDYDPQQPLQAELAAFVGCVDSGTQPVNDVRDGARVVRALQAATESMNTGRTVAFCDTQ